MKTVIIMLAGLISACGPDHVEIKIEVTGENGMEFSGALATTKDGKVTVESVSGKIPETYVINATFNTSDALGGTFQKSDEGDGELSAICIYDGKESAPASTSEEYGVISVHCAK